MIKKKIKHIAIAGNIGAGKTTLTTLLTQHYGWEVHYENANTNPYLNDFYYDMKRWSFNLQIYFLNMRFSQIINIQNGHKTTIQDRSIYEDANIFAPNLYDMGLMDHRDFNNYMSLFRTMTAQIDPPDLLIYLKADIPTLVAHIHRRGREYEGNMSLEYLKKLNDRYENWIDSYNIGRKLIINVDSLDFKNKREDFAKIVEMIEAEIHGLF